MVDKYLHNLIYFIFWSHFMISNTVEFFFAIITDKSFAITY